MAIHANYVHPKCAHVSTFRIPTDLDTFRILRVSIAFVCRCSIARQRNITPNCKSDVRAFGGFLPVNSV